MHAHCVAGCDQALWIEHAGFLEEPGMVKEADSQRSTEMIKTNAEDRWCQEEGMVVGGRSVGSWLNRAHSEGSRAMNLALKGETVLQEKRRLRQEDV